MFKGKVNKFFLVISKNYIKVIILSLVFLFMLLPIFKSGNKNINLLTMVGNKVFGSNSTEEIKSIEIESPDYKDNTPGSFHIDKSAEWTGIDTAKVTFDISSIMKTDDNYKDLILVIDISGSMEGEKLNKVKSDSIELVESLLSDSNNRVALIVYDSDSEIISEFTNDKDSIVDKINSLSDKGCTNYNAPLKHVDEIMDGYTKESNRDIITLFLTDGYPNEDTPNQIGTYELLKNKYPYMAINGIQYEMGNVVKDELIEVSDNQWLADMETLNNVLFEASVSPFVYEKFEVVDYIDKDHFILNSIDDIEVTTGTVKLEEENGFQKITWTLDNLYMTGSKQQMNINLSLKEQYVKTEGYYPTNDKEQVTYKLDSDTKIIKSDSTPILKSGYEVIYDSNTPSSCATTSTKETHYAYENVEIINEEPSCEGYLFKGWEIVTNVTKVNSDIFIMPSNDVTIRGTWTKQTLAKTMDGTIHESETLYKVVQRDAEEGIIASEYTGEVTDTYDEQGNENIYYYKGENPNNNVIFGNFCWQIVRTTATGGVKMIYNGIPNDGKCNNTGTSSQIGTSTFNSSYNSPAYVGYMYNKVYTWKNETTSSGALYGNGVEYDGTNYTLKNTSTTKDATHHYTCNNTTGTCSTVRYYYYNSYYIVLDGAQNIEEALNEMLKNDNVNSTNSTIKTTIDNWYSSNMTSYTDYLEDTVFCNDRSISNLGGWNPSGGSLTTYLYFGANSRDTANLKCTNETDRFSISNSKAKLTYPVGLLSMDETLLGKTTSKNSSDNYYLTTGSYYWAGSPSRFNYGNAFEYRVYSSGFLDVNRVYSTLGVRPAVSLIPGTVYSDGDGSKNNPYVVETN